MLSFSFREKKGSCDAWNSPPGGSSVVSTHFRIDSVRTCVGHGITTKLLCRYMDTNQSQSIGAAMPMTQRELNFPPSYIKGKERHNDRVSRKDKVQTRRSHHMTAHPKATKAPYPKCVRPNPPFSTVKTESQSNIPKCLFSPPCHSPITHHQQQQEKHSHPPQYPRNPTRSSRHHSHPQHHRQTFSCRRHRDPVHQQQDTRLESACAQTA